MREQTGKSRSLRILLDYYKHRGWLYWSRWICAAVGIVLAGGYGILVLLGSFATSGSESSLSRSWLATWGNHVSTGPISQVHAHFERDCQQCHAQGLMETALASDAFSFDRSERAQQVSQACQKCHPAQSHATTASNPTSKLIDQDCVHCHSEHNGRSVDLVAVDSSKCSQCHAELKVGGENTAIREFSVESHSVERKGNAGKTFRSLTQDTGRIKFDHSQHLRPGQVKEVNGQLHKGGFRTDMLPNRWRELYKSDGDLVQLACHDCHQLQSPSGPTKLESLANADTAVGSELSHFFAPVDFEKHCAACHQLTFTAQTADMLPLPHAAPRQEITRLLSAKIVGGKVSGQISAPPDLQPENGSRLISLSNFELKAAVASVYSRCDKCHEDNVANEEIFAKHHATDAAPLIPRQWLKLGLFNHGAHAKISKCADCHDVGADNKVPDNKTVMIKGPESCTPCHRHPTAGPVADTAAVHLASDDCRLCHRYHWSRPATESIGEHAKILPSAANE